MAAGDGRDVLGRAFGDDQPAAAAALRTEVDQPVGGLDDVEVVLDDEDGVPLVDQSLQYFEHIPKIRRRLQTLHDVGLDYMRLGQPATTLSGGEAQRVKLATELSKVATGRTLYILDEPTTGLHFEDIRKLLGVLGRLVDTGNTVIVIEHNLDVIKTADWIVDMGPEGGSGGGTVVAEGTPEDVAAVEASHTGAFLREILEANAAGTAGGTFGSPPARKPRKAAPRKKAVAARG